MNLVTHETCLEYFNRRLAEGWKCISRNGYNVVLESPEGILRPVDLLNDILTLRPDEVGDLTQFSTQFPATGEHYEKVDEVVADEDSTYIESLDLTPYSGIYIAIKENGVTTYGSLKDTTGVYTNYSETWALRPSDSQPFTEIDIAYLQIGVRAHTVQTDLFVLSSNVLLTGSTINSIKVYARAKNHTYVGDDLEQRVTQVYVEVDYTPPGEVENKYANMASKMVSVGII